MDVLEFVRMLKAIDVEVYFETDKIMSMDKDAELAISLASAVAQGDSESISTSIKWGQQKAAKNPQAKIYSRPCYGYRLMKTAI